MQSCGDEIDAKSYEHSTQSAERFAEKGHGGCQSKAETHWNTEANHG